MSLPRLLLISNSTNYGSGYLDHCAGEFKDFLGTVGRVLFVPYALYQQTSYCEKTRGRLLKIGLDIDLLADDHTASTSVAQAQAIFIGGGNTFRLLTKLYQTGALARIRERVLQGMPYIGSSAGTNVACPTIKTTNDMPIVQPPSFAALQLVPFNINPHYLDPDPSSSHQGETRLQRIAEYHEENENVVIGLREGAILRIEGRRVLLKGTAGAKIFRRGETPYDVDPGESLDFLL